MKKSISIIIILSLTGCGSSNNIVGNYLNVDNSNKIQLLNTGDFIFTSYDGMQGIYYSYGKWTKDSSGTVELSNRVIMPNIDFNTKLSDRSQLKFIDHRLNTKSSLSVLVNNEKIHLNELKNVYISNDSIITIEVIDNRDDFKLKRLELVKNLYEVVIIITEPANEISIEKMKLNVSRNFLIDDENNKFKKVN